MNILAIEANYDREILDRSEKLPDKVRHRITNSHLEIDQSSILRRRYYADKSLVETGEFTGMPSELVRKLESMGLRALRKMPAVEKIRKFYKQ